MHSVESLRSSRSSYAVALHGLLRDYGRDSCQLFLLTEGKDGDYYRPRVSSIFSGCNLPLSFRNIQGKKNLRALIKAIRRNSSLSEASYAAFFDRDFEQDLDDIAHESIFVTDSYSIENYYTDEIVVREVIRSVLFADLIHTDDDSDVVEEIVALYASMRKKFHHSVSLFNQWAWVQRHSLREGSLNLDKFDVEKCLELNFEEGTVSQRYNIDYLNSLAPERLRVTCEELLDAQSWFSCRDSRYSNRGKQEISFLYWFIKETAGRAATGSHPFRAVKRCGKRVSRNEIISELSAYARTPPELTDFLTKIRDRFEGWVRECFTNGDEAAAQVEPLSGE